MNLTYHERKQQMKKGLLGFIAGMACMGIVMSSGLVTNFTNATGSSRLSGKYKDIEKKLDLIDAVIDQYYLNQDEIDPELMEEYIYTGYVAGLEEKYSTYYTKEEYTSLIESTSGNYSGIGAYVSQNMNTGIITITKPFKNSPADKAGIVPDDILYKVEDEEVTGQDLNTVVAKLKGEEGTEVHVTIYRKSTDEYIEMTVTRAKIDVPTVEHEMKDGGVGYIAVSEFDDVTTDQFKKAVDDLTEQGMTSLVIDLRNNGGGLVDACCKMLDVVLPKELLVYTEDKDGKREEEYAKDDDELDMDIVILVNGNSASASEIFTGALKDYHKAVIIGTTTYGKGIVQSIVPLGDGSAVKLTSEKYYTPSDVCIHGTGIEPDYEVVDDVDTEADEVLDAALNYLITGEEPETAAPETAKETKKETEKETVKETESTKETK